MGKFYQFANTALVAAFLISPILGWEINNINNNHRIPNSWPTAKPPYWVTGTPKPPYWTTTEQPTTWPHPTRWPDPWDSTAMPTTWWSEETTGWSRPTSRWPEETTWRPTTSTTMRWPEETTDWTKRPTRWPEPSTTMRWPKTTVTNKWPNFPFKNIQLNPAPFQSRGFVSPPPFNPKGFNPKPKCYGNWNIPKPCIDGEGRNMPETGRKVKDAGLPRSNFESTKKGNFFDALKPSGRDVSNKPNGL